MEEFLTRSALPVSRAFSDLNSFVDLYGRVWATITRPGDYARIVPLFIARGEHGRAAIALLQILVLVAAASGVVLLG